MDEQIEETVKPRRMRRMGVAVGIAAGMILGSAGSAVAIHQFTDVPDSNPFHADIDWLVDNGVADGFPDGTYKPGSAVTRQSMAAFMRRLAGGDPTVDPMVDAALLEGRTPADFDNAVTLNGRTPADYDNAVTLNGLTSAQVGERLTAVVNADGTIARSVGTTSGVSLGTGRYEVVFNRNVTTCTFQATMGTPTAGNPISGFIGVSPRSGNVNAVFVEIRNTADTLADEGFYLTINCP